MTTTSKGHPNVNFFLLKKIINVKSELLHSQSNHRIQIERIKLG